GVGQEVQPAMHIGVFVAVGVRYGIDDGLRLLRRSAVVEIDQRLAVDLTRQDREIATDRLDIVGTAFDFLVHQPIRAPRTRLRALPRARSPAPRPRAPRSPRPGTP